MKRLRDILLINEHVCPWWLAYTFDNPLRRLAHPPEKVLEGLVSQGLTALDIGCGMGHFTLGMARMVGENGIVIALDLQEQMLKRVCRRAVQQGLSQRITAHRGPIESLNFNGEIDFALAFWMVHEVPDKKSFFKALKKQLKPDGRFLMAEPKIHTSENDIDDSLKLASGAGLAIVGRRDIRFSRAALLAHEGS